MAAQRVLTPSREGSIPSRPTMDIREIKQAKVDNVKRLAKFLGLKIDNTTSERQVKNLVKWRLNPRRQGTGYY